MRILSGMIRMRTSLSAVLLLGMAAQLVGQDSAGIKTKQIEDLVAHYQKYGYINGAILVADHANVIYAKGVGEANLEAHTLNTPHTKFGVASITKQFTAALVLQQIAEGKILLHGSVSEYLPWYRKDTGSRMTVEQLLHHTSGLPPDFDSPAFSATAEAGRHTEPLQFSENVCQPALTAEPGAKWQYSNCGYDLLGLILERVSGVSFEELLHRRLLDPLGMKDTGMDRNDLAQSGGASGYLRHAGPWYSPGPYLDRGHIFSAGAMYSTVEDLFRWNQVLSGGDFFPKEMREQIFTPGLNDWGYGWFITKIPAGQPGAGSTMAEMRGDMPDNFFAWILRYPERDAVIIVLRNVYGSTEGLEQNIQAILFDAEPRLPSRRPKDLAALIVLIPARWIAAHVALTVLIVLVVGLAIGLAAHRRRKLKSSISR
jgi:CubicO group peptidase (beta-lactamase class C family)